MPVNASPLRLPVALAVYVGWVLLTLFGMRWAGDGSKKPLLDTVSHGVGWNLAMAVALLAAATLAMRWRDLKFVAPRPVGSLRILWFPSLYLLLFAVLSVVLGLPPAATVGFVLLNTLLVGLSEEWMFRGVLFQALRSRLAMWPSILLMSAMFGAVHVLNVFVTGQLFDAVVQAMAAFRAGCLPQPPGHAGRAPGAPAAAPTPPRASSRHPREEPRPAVQRGQPHRRLGRGGPLGHRHRGGRRLHHRHDHGGNHHDAPPGPDRAEPHQLHAAGADERRPAGVQVNADSPYKNIKALADAIKARRPASSRPRAPARAASGTWR
jgi:membrane protease YdiL (CAAX protease family)